ncbi:hypothetical protein [Streptomyces sp. NPDC002537]
MKLKVVLDRVVCRDTEDIVGADEFYVSGVVATNFGAQPVLTKPMDIRNGQDLAFDTAQRVVFEGELPESGNLVINLNAWDSDFGKDWEEKGYHKAVKSIGDMLAERAPEALDAVRAAGKAPTADGTAPVAGDKAPAVAGKAPVAGEKAAPAATAKSPAAAGGGKTPTADADARMAVDIAKVVVEVVDKVLTSVVKGADPDDLLGTLTLDIPVTEIGREPRVMPKVWGFKQGGGAGISTWDYDVHYSIHVEP